DEHHLREPREDAIRPGLAAARLLDDLAREGGEPALAKAPSMDLPGERGKQRIEGIAVAAEEAADEGGVAPGAATEAYGVGIARGAHAEPVVGKPEIVVACHQVGITVGKDDHVAGVQ